MMYHCVEFFLIYIMKQTNQPSDQPIGFTVEGVLGLAGGRGAVAKSLGIHVQSVAKWGRRIPSAHARRVAILSGLPLAVVRPDMVQQPE